MSLYADYIKEREGREIVEDEFGFATYRIARQECYIVDIYVSPEHRRSGHAKKYADKITEIARERGCTYLLGTIVPSTNGSTESMKALLAYGFQIHSCKEDMIFLTKEI